VPWPELAPDTVAVVSTLECDGILLVSLAPRYSAEAGDCDQLTLFGGENGCER
jgi:hypothetical protein